MRDSRLSPPKFRPAEITIHFDDLGVSSEEFIARAAELGINLRLNAAQLDELRAELPALREWLSHSSLRRQAFLADPEDAVTAFQRHEEPAVVAGTAPPDIRWRGLSDDAMPAEAGHAVTDWVLRQSDGLSQLVSQPRAVIEAALALQSPEERQAVLSQLDAFAATDAGSVAPTEEN